MKKSIFILLLLPQLSWGALQGPVYATLCANDSSFGTNAWNNVTNGCADDGSVASISGSSQYLKATTLAASVPSMAVIQGVVAEVKKQATSGQFVLDTSVRLYVNGVVSGNDKAKAGDWVDTGLTYYTYGSPTDTWGLSLTGADVNNSGFGLAFASQKDAGGTQTANVDAIRFTFYYLVNTTINNGTLKGGTLR